MRLPAWLFPLGAVSGWLLAWLFYREANFWWRAFGRATEQARGMALDLARERGRANGGA